MILVLLGPPGSGKGTQARKLSDALGYPQLSTGDMLREAIKSGSDLGKSVSEIMKRGELVPDSVVLSLIKERLARTDCRKGFTLDGFPRNVSQAEALSKILDSDGRKLGKVVDMSLDSDVIVQRLSGRRTCRGCGAGYHILFQPSVVSNKCDRCAGELIQRNDDVEGVIRERLRVYELHTAPLLDYYRERGLLVSIDASATPGEVTSSLMKIAGCPEV